ncbi:MAG: putative hydrolase or acyltransferases (alpha/beta hydrolase superfamily) [halophilic archaeon J07HX5]|jgi:Predicted hydrolases or acyltransferases (alpha/beta hydrolase superfamily)|nr:MAG: putative hydrolase or acyltransferases (alpha/beta hydrolase superfamily) [halophilic archaeon J07HX5]
MKIPKQWEVGTVQSNDVDLRYYRAGKGQPIVLAHGFYESAQCRKPIIQNLAEEYEIIAYDARGHGYSDAPKQGYDIEQRVSDLHNISTGLGLEDPILFGHSMGAVTVAWSAAHHPELPKGVVLEDPVGLVQSETPSISPEERVAAVEQKLSKIDEQTVEQLAADHTEYEESVSRRIAHANKRCSKEVAEIAREQSPPVTNALSKIDYPVLIINSDDNPESKAKQLNAVEEFKHTRLVHIPEAGHAVFRGEFEAAYSELSTFLHRI